MDLEVVMYLYHSYAYFKKLYEDDRQMDIILVDQPHSLSNRISTSNANTKDVERDK